VQVQLQALPWGAGEGAGLQNSPVSTLPIVAALPTDVTSTGPLSSPSSLRDEERRLAGGQGQGGGGSLGFRTLLSGAAIISVPPGAASTYTITLTPKNSLPSFGTHCPQQQQRPSATACNPRARYRWQLSHQGGLPLNLRYSLQWARPPGYQQPLCAAADVVSS